MPGFLPTINRRNADSQKRDGLSGGRMVGINVQLLPLLNISAVSHVWSTKRNLQRWPRVGQSWPERVGWATGEWEECLAGVAAVFTLLSQWCDLWQVGG